jgi:hypothetical protein
VSVAQGVCLSVWLWEVPTVLKIKLPCDLVDRYQHSGGPLPPPSSLQKMEVADLSEMLVSV